MKREKKRARIWIIAGVSTAVLAIVFLAVNSIWGNPVSAAIANSQMNAYLSEKYPSLGLVDSKGIAYDFMNRIYVKTVLCPGSADIHFYVECNLDGPVQDDYAESVLSGANTLSRLSGEYSKLAFELLGQNPEVSGASVIYQPGESEDLSGILQPDMAFDKSLPINAAISVQMLSSDLTSQHFAKFFEEIHALMRANGCNFITYELTAENGKSLVMVSGVTPGDIESGDLANRIDAAFKNPDAGTIRAFQKE